MLDQPQFKRCVDCKHNVSKLLFNETNYRYCTAKGGLSSAWKMRYKKSTCGIQGKLWEPREYIGKEDS